MVEEKVNNNYEKASNLLNSMSNFVLNTIEAIIIALALSILLYIFIATPHEVVGSSMHPTFKNGEYLIGNKITFRFREPVRGDVIIYEYDESVDYIKRIVGLPGETIALIEGKIYIDGKKLDETTYLDNSIYTPSGEWLFEEQEIKIPEGEYFTMGDNRTGSYDSRNFGTIKREKIKGIASVVYFPFSNFRINTTPDMKLTD